MLKQLFLSAALALAALMPISAQESIPQLDSLLIEAQNGDADAQCVLGYMYYNGEGVTQNYTEAA